MTWAGPKLVQKLGEERKGGSVGNYKRVYTERLDSDHLFIAVKTNQDKNKEYVVNLSDMKKKMEMPLDSEANTKLKVKVSPCGRFIAIGGDELKVYLREKAEEGEEQPITSELKQIVSLPLGSNWITDMRISSNFLFFE